MTSNTKIFAPASVPESNAIGYPEPFRALVSGRFYRRLGDHAGLTNFGVNLTRLVPGGLSSCRHAHSRQDEFVYVLEGEVELATDYGAQTLGPGMCVGFPAGSGDAHCFRNASARDVVLLVVGDRTVDDVVSYPDHDLAARFGSDGRNRFTHKDGTPY